MLSLSIKSAFETLDQYRPEVITNCDNHLVKFIKLLEFKQCIFDQYCLYIGKANYLPDKFPSNTVINIISLGLHPEQIELKNTTNINLCIIDANADLSIVFNNLQKILTEYNQNRYNSMKNLMFSFGRGYGLQYIIDKCSDILEKPIYLNDTSFNLICHSKNKVVTDAIYDEILTNGHFSWKTVSYFMRKRGVEKIRLSNEPIYLNADCLNSLNVQPRLIMSLKHDNKSVATLTMVGCDDPEADMEIFKLLGEMIQIELKRSNYLSNIDSKRAKLFKDLLAGKLQDVEAQESLEQLKMNSQKYYYIISVIIQPDDLFNTYLPFVKETLEKILPECISLLFEDHLTLLTSIEINHSSYLLELDNYLKKNNMKGGISLKFSSLLHIKKYYQQSIKAIELGNHMKIEKTLYYYHNFALHHIAELCSLNEKLSNLCHDSILQLVEYDKKNNTDYVLTLYVYFTYNRNLLITSQVLHVHRNTVNYRIKKITEMLNLNWDDGKTLFTLFLSLVNIEYIERKMIIPNINVDKFLIRRDEFINN